MSSPRGSNTTTAKINEQDLLNEHDFETVNWEDFSTPIPSRAASPFVSIGTDGDAAPEASTESPRAEATAPLPSSIPANTEATNKISTSVAPTSTSAASESTATATSSAFYSTADEDTITLHSPLPFKLRSAKFRSTIIPSDEQTAIPTTAETNPLPMASHITAELPHDRIQKLERDVIELTLKTTVDEVSVRTAEQQLTTEKAQRTALEVELQKARERIANLEAREKSLQKKLAAEKFNTVTAEYDTTRAVEDLKEESAKHEAANAAIKALQAQLVLANDTIASLQNNAQTLKSRDNILTANAARQAQDAKMLRVNLDQARDTIVSLQNRIADQQRKAKLATDAKLSQFVSARGSVYAPPKQTAAVAVQTEETFTPSYTVSHLQQGPK